MVETGIITGILNIIHHNLTITEEITISMIGAGIHLSVDFQITNKKILIELIANIGLKQFITSGT